MGVLHFAARAGNLETSTLLLGRWLADDNLVQQGMRAYGGPLDWRDRWHRTPVHWAVLNNHALVLKVLLEAKAEAVPPRVPVSKFPKTQRSGMSPRLRSHGVSGTMRYRVCWSAIAPSTT